MMMVVVVVVVVRDCERACKNERMNSIACVGVIFFPSLGRPRNSTCRDWTPR